MLVVTVANDATPPTVSITAPAAGATVAGTVTVSVSATDNVGVVGVQFKLDGANLGAEVTAAPYSVSWNTTTATSGAHTLTATARDAASNTATATASVTVTLSVPLTVNTAGSGTGTVTSTPAGISCGTDCSEPYASGTVVTLTATPAVGSVFTGWSGGSCTGTGPCTVTLSAATTVTATFTPTFTLTVSKAGTGSGTVTSTPAGITCGTNCSASYVSGTAVTLTATPAAGSVFTGWSGGGRPGPRAYRVALAAAPAVPPPFTLTVSKTGSGSGTVTSTPAGITCGTSCSASYASGTLVTLTATPAIGSVFTGWSGGGCTGTGACSVTLTAATTVTATFTPTFA